MLSARQCGSRKGPPRAGRWSRNSRDNRGFDGKQGLNHGVVFVDNLAHTLPGGQVLEMLFEVLPDAKRLPLGGDKHGADARVSGRVELFAEPRTKYLVDGVISVCPPERDHTHNARGSLSGTGWLSCLNSQGLDAHHVLFVRHNSLSGCRGACGARSPHRGLVVPYFPAPLARRRAMISFMISFGPP